MKDEILRSEQILNVNVHALALKEACQKVLSWGEERESRYVCVTNVHAVMEAHDDRGFRRILNGADLVLPDGMPLVWALRLKGHRRQKRLFGRAVTRALCQKAGEEGLPVGFYGSRKETLEAMVANLKEWYPGLEIPYSYSPPFRPLSEEEDREIVEEINASGVGLLFVGLGCPKQEKWMAEHRSRVKAVMIGVGAVFDFFAGQVDVAPQWMQLTGLEWFYRLLKEPRRLWNRYWENNPRYLLYLAFQLLRWRKFKRKERER